METIRATICKNFIRLLNDSKLSQKEIAKRAGVSEPTLYRWKSGENTPELTNIESLAKALEVDPFEFYRVDKSFKEPLKLSVFSKQLQKIPDDIFEMAQEFELDDEAWETTRIVFNDRIKRLQASGLNSQQA